MSALGPSTGRPDDEAYGIPHGSILQEEAGKAVGAGGTNLIASGFFEIGAYRSLAILVKNTGAADVQFTPQWNLVNGANSILPSETQTVPAGTSKRLLFQNQGDIVKQVQAKGVGAGSTITYQMVPSNLDPLVSSSRAILYVIQRTPAQSVLNNTPTLIEFGPTAGTLFYTNDSALFSFDLTGAGDINGVHLLGPGLWLIYSRLTFAAPGNYDKVLQLNAASSETNPIGNANEEDRNFDATAPTMQATTILALSAGSAVAASNTITVSGTQVSGAAVNVDQATLWVARLSSVFP